MSDAQIEAAARNLETTAKIDQFSSILFGAVAPEGEPREALAALVTSLGRDTLQATADVAEKELGLEVIYGDTDSIMINTRTDDLAVVKDLGLKVKKAVNKRYRLLELELDGIFKTMCVTQRRE